MGIIDEPVLRYTINKDLSIRCFEAIENDAQYAEFLALFYEYSQSDWQEFFFKDKEMLRKTKEYLATKSSVSISKVESDKVWVNGPLGETIILRAGKRFM